MFENKNNIPGISIIILIANLSFLTLLASLIVSFNILFEKVFPGFPGADLTNAYILIAIAMILILKEWQESVKLKFVLNLTVLVSLLILSPYIVFVLIAPFINRGLIIK